MASYEEIYGKRVDVLSSDPSTLAGGEVWYNSTTGTLKTVVSFRAYSSTTNLPSARGINAPGGATQNSGLSIGGATPPDIANTEEWNGSGWTAGGNYPAGKAYLGAAGPQTAALAGGGSGYPDAANTYDGTSWTGVNAMPDGYEACRYIGTATAGIMVSGGEGTAYPAAAHKWDGSSWTSGGSLPGPKNYGSTVSGTQTAAFSAGGSYPQKNTTANYDGSSWTTSGNLPTNSYNMIGNSVGGQTSGVTQGGNATSFPAIAPAVYHYDGSVWAADINCPLSYTNTGASFGPQSAHVFAGGNAPGIQSTTQEYNVSINTITPATWASAPATNTALGTTAGCGSVTAALVFSGADALTNSEKYDGTSWTATPALNVGRYGAGEATNAPQTAALCFGGVADPGTNNKDATEEWNGSAWSTQTALPVAMRQLAGFGIQTAAVSIGGYSTTYIAESYEYNGSSWAAGGDMNTSRERAAGCGLESAGLAMGGNNPSPYIANVEEYDGSSWTNGTALPIANKLGSAAGTQTDAIFFAGNIPPNSVVGTTYGYDGTIWSTRPSMGTARQAGAGAGTSTAALMMAGANGSGTALTTVEEYTGEVVTATASTLTTS